MKINWWLLGYCLGCAATSTWLLNTALDAAEREQNFHNQVRVARCERMTQPERDAIKPYCENIGE